MKEDTLQLSWITRFPSTVCVTLCVLSYTLYKLHLRSQCTNTRLPEGSISRRIYAYIHRLYVFCGSKVLLWIVSTAHSGWCLTENTESSQSNTQFVLQTDLFFFNQFQNCFNVETYSLKIPESLQ